MFNRSVAIALALAGLLATAPAGAVMKQPEDAVELMSTDISLPGEAGSFLIKTCSECDYMRVYLTRNTRFFIDREQVTLKELRKRASAAKHLLYVFYDVETRMVNRIVLDAA